MRQYDAELFRAGNSEDLTKELKPCSQCGIPIWHGALCYVCIKKQAADIAATAMRLYTALGGQNDEPCLECGHGIEQHDWPASRPRCIYHAKSADACPCEEYEPDAPLTT